MPLTDAKIRSLKPQARPQKIFDGGGLYLFITPAGSKVWRIAYRYQGKQQQRTVGPYPIVSLAEARKARDSLKKLLLEEVDPAEIDRIEEQRRKLAAASSFRAVGDEWFELRQAGWSAAYRQRLRVRLETDLYPRLGRRPIADIEPIDVLETIRKIEARGTIETGKRIMQMASMIFRYGVATGRCKRDPTQDLRGALRTPPPSKRRVAMAAGDLPEFLCRLDAYDGERVTRLALKLIVLTFVRTGEVRFARWSEFEDLEGDKPLWRIPAERMKMRRGHLVPLAPQAVAVLKEAKRYSANSEYVFPAATRSKVPSENTLLYALYRMGYHQRATVHGFRSTASTILNENEFNRDWIELQLAHVEDSIRGIYNAAEWLAGRRQMMCWWADYLDRARASAAPPARSAIGG